MLALIKKILYATDLGGNAPRVFNYAVSLAKSCEAEIHLLHAIEPLGHTGRTLVRSVVPDKQFDDLERQGLEHVRNAIHQRLAEFAQRELGTDDERATLVNKIVIAEGQADTVIIQQAEQIGADLIVMGTHSQSTLDRVLLGSVARKVTHLSTIPVLLVPIPAES
ncbi:universal stress protein [Sedimenticola sp.]|uniref:universal stress protein n=1 Tax=Sedimenticola sp. TaxID=1940285 RepID=UPI003D0B48B7